MEDLQGKLEREVVRNLELPKPGKLRLKEDWELVLVGDTGRMFRFGSFRSVAFALAAGAVLLIVGGVLAGRVWSRDPEGLSALRTHIAGMATRIEGLETRNAELSARLAIERVRQDEKAARKAPVDPEASSIPRVPSQLRAATDGVRLPIVEVADFRCKRSGKTARAALRVENVSDSGQVVSGSVFVLLLSDDGDWAASPAFGNAARKITGKDGETFSIARFKTVKLAFDGLKPGVTYSRARIHVFDQRGRLLFERTVPVS